MRINSRERILLKLMVLVVAGWLTFNYVIEEQMETISNLNLELKASKAELENLRTLIVREPEIDAAIEQNYAKIQEVASSFFNTTPLEERILLLNDFLLMPFIEDTSLVFGDPEMIDIEGLQFIKDSVQIELSGQYESFVNMMVTILSFPQEIDISSISLYGAGFDEISGSISLDFYTFAAESGIVDGLYKWYVDDLFYKENPFSAIEENNTVVRYLYLHDDTLFNYTKYYSFSDIEGHWLEDEINEFLDYGYLYLNPYLEFEPDEPISRGEFIVLLDSVYNWPLGNEDVDLTAFRDYDDLGSLESSFAKAVHRGYLSGFVEGYEDSTLRPRDPITYREAQLIMQRVKHTEGFGWSQVADSFSWRKNHYSDQWSDLDNMLTRAEAVYMLYYYK